MFLAQTSRTACESSWASSGSNHLPSSIWTTTPIASKTSARVSSEVISKNGPRSLMIRGAKETIALSSTCAQKLSGENESVIRKLHTGDELSDSLDSRYLHRNTGVTCLKDIHRRVDVLACKSNWQTLGVLTREDKTSSL